MAAEWEINKGNRPSSSAQEAARVSLDFLDRMPHIVAETDGLDRKEDSCRYADSPFEVPAPRPPFLRGYSVVNVHPRPHHAVYGLSVNSFDFGNSFWQTA
jgi:hypothetical protein